MRHCLTDRQRSMLALAEKVAPALAERAAGHDRDNTFPHDGYADLREAGLLRLTVPEELGGLGADQQELLLVLEHLAAADGATALSYAMHAAPLGSWALTWRRTGAPPLEQALRLAGMGRLVLAAIASEVGTPNLFTDAKTTATRVPGGYVLDGRKNFGTNSAAATMWASTARFEDPDLGPRLLILLVDPSGDGITIEQTWDTLGMRATQSNDIVFAGHFVPDQAVVQSIPIGHLDAQVLETIICWTAPSFGAVYTGIAAGALAWSVEQVKQRDQQHDPRIQDAIADAETAIEVNRSVLARHAAEVMSGNLVTQFGVQEGFARCALVKNVCTNNAAAVMTRLVDVVGGGAISRRLPFERMWRDVQAGLVMPINNRTGRELLGACALGVETAPVVPHPFLDAGAGRA
ncbi:acyl-CoA dehydrogenase family protein [Nonomuraea sp. AD125B]|uniref:Dibenzothiophene monooxygenase n=1 Tax=Nonomuraea wenchangensis TaxID=568860 RepID=A0A1I0L5Q7_9ACTN|nr:acyl-CoA dehydrogenase family protein [Nonomuraea wenchangensis]SEU34287.1 Acyl-CoA dehydrogenase [Nonomuraea wenchangensis]